MIDPPAALVEDLADPKAWRVERHQKHGRAFGDCDVWVGAGVDNEQLRHRPIGDIEFGTVEDPLIVPPLGLKF